MGHFQGCRVECAKAQECLPLQWIKGCAKSDVSRGLRVQVVQVVQPGAGSSLHQLISQMLILPNSLFSKVKLVA